MIGKLEIKARLREPLLAKQIRVTREQILKIEKHFPITSPPITQPSNTNVKQPSKPVTPVESTSPMTPVKEEPVTAVPEIVVESEKPTEEQDKEDFTSGPPSTESAPKSGQLTPVNEEPVTPMPVTPVSETSVKEVPVTPVTDAQPATEVPNNDVPADWDR